MTFDVSSGTGGLVCVLAFTLAVAVLAVEIRTKLCHLHHGRPCPVELQHIEREVWIVSS